MITLNEILEGIKKIEAEEKRKGYVRLGYVNIFCKEGVYRPSALMYPDYDSAQQDSALPDQYVCTLPVDAREMMLGGVLDTSAGADTRTP